MDAVNVDRAPDREQDDLGAQRHYSRVLPPVTQYGMAVITDSDTEETGAQQVKDDGPLATGVSKPRDFLRGAWASFTAEELSAPVVSRFLAEEIERLEAENRILSQYRDKFHHADKQVASLERDEQYSRLKEFRDAAILAIGSAGMGAAPGYIQISNLGWVFFGLSVALTIVSLFFRLSKK